MNIKSIKYPKICNICGGKVIYCSNAEIYGVEYGSGKCYLCTKCGAYVGTHKPRPKEALGLLADEQMRKGKIDYINKNKIRGITVKELCTEEELRNYQ